MGEMIFYFVVYMAEAFIAWQYCGSILVSKYRKTVEVSAFFVGYCVLYLISNTRIFWLNYIEFFCVNTLLIYYLFYISRKKSAFYAIVLTAIMAITELVIAAIMAWCFLGFESYKRNILVLTVSAILCKSLYYLCLQIILRLFFKKKRDDSESGAIIILLCVIPLISIWITAVFLLVGFYGTLPSNLTWLVMVSAILMLVMNMLIFWIYDYTQKANHKFTEMQLQLQKETADARYYQMLSEQDENQRILIHDIRKHLSTISGLLDSETDERVKAYIAQIADSPELKAELHFCDNSTLNLILARYFAICEKEGIRFDVDIRKRCLDFMRIEDMTSVFSNLLENAVEASRNAENSLIELDVKKSGSGQVLIVLLNSCGEKPVQLPDGKFVSRKKDRKNHGLGMKSVEKAIKRYGGTLNAYYNEAENIFRTVILLNEEK